MLRNKANLAYILLRRAARIGTWVCAFLLAILSLAPDDWLLRSNEFLDIQPIPFVEHALAYFLTGIIVAIGYSPRYRKPQLVLLLIAYAAILELGQHLTPDRSPRFAEFWRRSYGRPLRSGHRRENIRTVGQASMPRLDRTTSGKTLLSRHDVVGAFRRSIRPAL